MEATISQSTSRLQDGGACALIDLLTQDLLRNIEQAILLADELGRGELSASLRSRAREVAETMLKLRDNRQCGSECWLG